MRRILGRMVFQLYPNRTLGEIISRLAELEAMAAAPMRFDDAMDLCSEQDALEDELDRRIGSHLNYTRH